MRAAGRSGGPNRSVYCAGSTQNTGPSRIHPVTSVRVSLARRYKCRDAGGDPTPAGAAHRPVELAQAPDGSLYLSDDKAGWMADLLCRSGSPK